MNTPLILKISAVILLGGLHTVHAARDAPRAEPRKGKSTGYPGGTSIGCTHNGNEGTVTFKQNQVWKGKVRKGLNGIAKLIDGEEYAAAWDGKKLVWENVPGAGAKLKPELRELLKKQQKLLD